VPVEEKKTRTAGETRVLPLPLRSAAAGANMCSGTIVSRSGIEVHLRGPSRSSPVAFPMEARQAAVDANTGPASALSLRLAAQAGPRLRDHACMADFISFRASKRGPVCSVLQPPGVDDARSARQGKAREFNSIGWLQRSLADRLDDDVVSAIPLPSSSCSHQHGSRA
jgi:hypothetical protein